MDNKKSFFNDWGSELSVERNNIVFQGRNIDYGAYDLRKYYGKRVLIALGIALFIFILALSTPALVKLFSKKEEVKKATKSTTANIGPPPSLEKQPPPPPKVKYKEIVKQVKFIPPKVVKKPEKEPELPPNTQPQKPTPPDNTNLKPDAGGFTPPPDPGPPPKKQEPYTYVEQMPSFPGGEEKLFQFLADNLKYPPYARENNITGTVFLSFVVNEDGVISEVQVLRGISGGAVCDAEAKRVVEAMPPWKPGKQNGRAVPVRYNLPIKFKLN